ncbi:A/G-specific adenine glycosylase [Microbacterium indicum]|uniref:A/G-specific adenine glycosylase n=1 Tax=Microbacterium indicum TaxID=358100 RepID=UPI0003F7CC8F|nr:A/G-specific adenine glycosylase [Microbacterium indicum]
MPSTAIADALATWYRAEARDLPWRRPGFGAWGTLVSEFMLQQTPVARVIPLLEAWLERWPTPSDLAGAAPADAVTQWANLGYPRRALWLHRAAVEIRDRHDGVVPRDVDDLLALTGIGDYTARAVAVFAYGDRHPVVDTNTRRVLTRALEAKAHPAAAHRRDLEAMAAILPASASEAAIVDAAAMELGQVICTARSPKCGSCPIAHECAWLAAGSPETADTRVKQARYEGSDRQARGRILQALRAADPDPVPFDALIAEWPDRVQRGRAIDSLLADGLVSADGELASLPR